MSSCIRIGVRDPISFGREKFVFPLVDATRRPKRGCGNRAEACGLRVRVSRLCGLMFRERHFHASKPRRELSKGKCKVILWSRLVCGSIHFDPSAAMFLEGALWIVLLPEGESRLTVDIALKGQVRPYGSGTRNAGP